jgi:hypothetical protein
MRSGEIEVSCRRLKTYGEGDETSSHGETEMVTQEAIKVAERELSEKDKIAFFTDNLSAVQGTNEYVLTNSKISRLLRSKLRESFRRLKPVIDKIQSRGASVQVNHTLNDHHRPYWMKHQLVTCRLNRAADSNAEEAARWEGIDDYGNELPPNNSFGAIAEGRLGQPKSGGPVAISRNRVVLGSDFRKAIRDVMNHKLAKYLGMSPIQGSIVNRDRKSVV